MKSFWYRILSSRSFSIFSLKNTFPYVIINLLRLEKHFILKGEKIMNERKSFLNLYLQNELLKAERNGDENITLEISPPFEKDLRTFEEILTERNLRYIPLSRGKFIVWLEKVHLNIHNYVEEALENAKKAGNTTVTIEVMIPQIEPLINYLKEAHIKYTPLPRVGSYVIWRP